MTTDRGKPKVPHEEKPPPDREDLIDEILEATFPASDPPTWDSVARTPPDDADPDHDPKVLNGTRL